MTSPRLGLPKGGELRLQPAGEIPADSLLVERFQSRIGLKGLFSMI
jgi:hypothetical protein